MSETHEKIAESSPSSALIQYLDRRRTQPIGVVNVRQLQPRFLRVSGAIAQRFTLLERLQTRYGIDEEQAGSDAELTLATLSQSLPENPSNYLSEIAQSIATVTKPAAPTTIPETTSKPAETFRVSRKVIPPLASFSVPGKTGEKGDKGDKGDKGETRENVSSSKTTLVVPEKEALAKPFAEQSIAPSESFPSLPLKSLEKTEQDDVTRNDITVPTKSATSEGEREPEKKHTTASQLPLAKVIVTRTQASSESISLPLAKAQSTPLIQRQIEQASTTEQRQTLNVVNQPEGNYIQPSQLPLAKISPQQSQLGDINQTGEQSAILFSAKGFANASEIPLHQSALSQPTMVWRKSDNTGSEMTRNGNAIAPPPFAMNPINQNSQFGTHQPMQANNNYATPIAAPATQNAISHPVATANLQTSRLEPHINVAQIAEQVSRILSRQLTVERERRGIGR